MDVVELHERALDQAARLVAAVDPAQLDGPTPCAGWDVRALLAHLVSGNRCNQAVAEGERPQRGGTAAEVLGDDPAAAYRETARPPDLSAGGRARAPAADLKTGRRSGLSGGCRP